MGPRTVLPGVRSDGSIFTVETLGQYMVHDPVHHVREIDQACAMG